MVLHCMLLTSVSSASAANGLFTEIDSFGVAEAIDSQAFAGVHIGRRQRLSSKIIVMVWSSGRVISPP